MLDGRTKRLIECKEKYEGLVFHHKSFGNYSIVKYNGWRCVEIEFVNTGGRLVTSMSNIVRGSVRDGMAATVYGVGVTGGVQVRVGETYDKAYVVWKGMLQRCYTEDYQRKFPSYVGCTVDGCFKFYPNFKEWYYSQENYKQVGLELDKDLLVKGNKVYSPRACCLVPLEVNTALTLRNNGWGSCAIGVHLRKDSSKYSATISEYGRSTHLGYFLTEQAAFAAYKKRKELYLKELAEKWKPSLREDAYLALKSWEITEDD